MDTQQVTRAVAEASMLVRRPAAEVYEAMVNPAITSQFWYSAGSGRLDEGRKVTWEWKWYNAKDEITPLELEKDRSIVFVWGGNSKVTMTFNSVADGTFVTVREQGWDKLDHETVAAIVGQTEGWTIVLAGLKAYLEHGLRLKLVEDHKPPA